MTSKKNKPQVSIIMGSKSDLDVMSKAEDILKDFKVSYELKIVSAHRTPEYMNRYAKEAKKRGVDVIIAGAGGAAHLPGMVASMTTLPVIGVPIDITSLQGLDSYLSIVQMPKGVPVATVAIDNSTNAALLAIRMLALKSKRLQTLLEDFRLQQRKKVKDQNKETQKS